MTPEHIKKVKSLATWGDSWVLREEILRLLEEREGLLRAAKGVHDLLGNEPHDPVEARGALAAAIAYAEEP